MPTFRAMWNDVVIAESDDTIVVDGHRYFPATSVHDEHLTTSTHHSVCGWKGQASYYDVTAGGATDQNAAWYYPDPKPAAGMVGAQKLTTVRSPRVNVEKVRSSRVTTKDPGGCPSRRSWDSPGRIAIAGGVPSGARPRTEETGCVPTM